MQAQTQTSDQPRDDARPPCVFTYNTVYGPEARFMDDTSHLLNFLAGWCKISRSTVMVVSSTEVRGD